MKKIFITNIKKFRILQHQQQKNLKLQNRCVYKLNTYKISVN